MPERRVSARKGPSLVEWAKKGDFIAELLKDEHISAEKAQDTGNGDPSIYTASVSTTLDKNGLEQLSVQQIKQILQVGGEELFYAASSTPAKPGVNAAASLWHSFLVQAAARAVLVHGRPSCDFDCFGLCNCGDGRLVVKCAAAGCTHWLHPQCLESTANSAGAKVCPPCASKTVGDTHFSDLGTQALNLYEKVDMHVITETASLMQLGQMCTKLYDATTLPGGMNARLQRAYLLAHTSEHAVRCFVHNVNVWFVACYGVRHGIPTSLLLDLKNSRADQNYFAPVIRGLITAALTGADYNQAVNIPFEPKRDGWEEDGWESMAERTGEVLHALLNFGSILERAITLDSAASGLAGAGWRNAAALVAQASVVLPMLCRILGVDQEALVVNSERTVEEELQEVLIELHAARVYLPLKSWYRTAFTDSDDDEETDELAALKAAILAAKQAVLELPATPPVLHDEFQVPLRHRLSFRDLWVNQLLAGEHSFVEKLKRALAGSLEADSDVIDRVTTFQQGWDLPIKRIAFLASSLAVFAATEDLKILEDHQLCSAGWYNAVDCHVGIRPPRFLATPWKDSYLQRFIDGKPYTCHEILHDVCTGNNDAGNTQLEAICRAHLDELVVNNFAVGWRPFRDCAAVYIAIDADNSVKLMPNATSAARAKSARDRRKSAANDAGLESLSQERVGKRHKGKKGATTGSAAPFLKPSAAMRLAGLRAFEAPSDARPPPVFTAEEVSADVTEHLLGPAEEEPGEEDAEVEAAEVEEAPLDDDPLANFDRSMAAYLREQDSVVLEHIMNAENMRHPKPGREYRPRVIHAILAHCGHKDADDGGVPDEAARRERRGTDKRCQQRMQRWKKAARLPAPAATGSSTRPNAGSTPVGAGSAMPTRRAADKSPAPRSSPVQRGGGGGGGGRELSALRGSKGGRGKAITGDAYFDLTEVMNTASSERRLITATPQFVDHADVCLGLQNPYEACHWPRRILYTDDTSCAYDALNMAAAEPLLSMTAVELASTRRDASSSGLMEGVPVASNGLLALQLHSAGIVLRHVHHKAEKAPFMETVMGQARGAYLFEFYWENDGDSNYHVVLINCYLRCVFCNTLGAIPFTYVGVGKPFAAVSHAGFRQAAESMRSHQAVAKDAFHVKRALRCWLLAATPA